MGSVLDRKPSLAAEPNHEDSQVDTTEAVAPPKAEEIKDSAKLESSVTDRKPSLTVEQNQKDSQADSTEAVKDSAKLESPVTDRKPSLIESEVILVEQRDNIMEATKVETKNDTEDHIQENSREE